MLALTGRADGLFSGAKPLTDPDTFGAPNGSSKRAGLGWAGRTGLAGPGWLGWRACGLLIGPICRALTRFPAPPSRPSADTVRGFVRTLTSTVANRAVPWGAPHSCAGD